MEFGGGMSQRHPATHPLPPSPHICGGVCFVASCRDLTSSHHWFYSYSLEASITVSKRYRFGLQQRISGQRRTAKRKDLVSHKQAKLSPSTIQQRRFNSDTASTATT